MIPDNIVDFLGDNVTVGVGGTRDKDLVPHIHRISGWIVSNDRKTITCSVPEEYTGYLIDSLEENGEFALTVTRVGTHETYQFKGKYVESRPCNENDIIAFKGCRERFANVVPGLFGFTEHVAQAYIIEPAIAISFNVQEVFVQTPGPGAGRRLVPPMEE